MVPMALEELNGPMVAGPIPGGDRLRRVVQVTLAIYLLPVVAIVCAIGGASIVIGGASRFATRLVARSGRAKGPVQSPYSGPCMALSKTKTRMRARVHR